MSFVAPDDVHITEISPLLDAGSCVQTPGTDIDGDPRPIGSGCEIGADEFNPETSIFSDDFETGNLSLWSDVGW